MLVPRIGQTGLLKEDLGTSLPDWVTTSQDQQAFQKERYLAHISRLMWMVKRKCFTTPESNLLVLQLKG